MSNSNIQRESGVKDTRFIDILKAVLKAKETWFEFKIKNGLKTQY